MSIAAFSCYFIVIKAAICIKCVKFPFSWVRFRITVLLSLDCECAMKQNNEIK